MKLSFTNLNNDDDDNNNNNINNNNNNNNNFAHLKCAYLKKWKVLQCAICVILFLYEDECIARFSCISVPLTSSNYSISKNYAHPNKHVHKNLKFGIAEFFSPYFVTKALIIWEVLVVFIAQNHWYPKTAIWAKGLSVGELNTITWEPHLIP